MSQMTTFPKELFTRHKETTTDVQHVVVLMDYHHLLQRRYGTTYSKVAASLQALRSGTHPVLSTLNEEQHAALEEALTLARDVLAKRCTQARRLLETSINELAPDTFPAPPEGTDSDDVADGFCDWVLAGIEGAAHWVTDRIRDAADVCYDLGADDVGEAFDTTADALDDLVEAGREVGEAIFEMIGPIGRIWASGRDNRSVPDAPSV